MKGDLIKLYYDRTSSTTETTLTPENCEELGYVQTTTTVDGTEYTVYYDVNDETKTPLLYEIVDGVAVTKVLVHNKTRYQHVAPPCSKFAISFADVDKSGSGRNETTGEMARERLGSYTKFEIAWDLIPNSKEYNNWYKILTHLPPYFYAQMLMPTGVITEKKLYRGDVSTELYLFTDGEQIWKGLSTSFIEWNVNTYNDDYEPELEEID